MPKTIWKYKYRVVLVLVVVMLTAGAANTQAEIDLVVNEPARHQELNLISGKSVVLKTARSIDRVAVGSPEIADFLRLSPRELYITGKIAGTTNLILWKGKEVVSLYDVKVTYDLSSLKSELFKILPEEKDIRVTSSQDCITLSGRVSSNANLSRAVSLARSYVPREKEIKESKNGKTGRDVKTEKLGKHAKKDRVINLLTVGGVHQVMLEVRLAEMQRSTGKTLGIDFSYSRGDEFGVSMLAGLHNYLGGVASTAVKALFQFQDGNTTWTTLIDALKEDGMAKILAEPTLISLSGQKASFLAGGEFPIPVPDDDGITIEYKQFGVGLTFTPTVLSSDKINIEVDSSVSELDFSTAVKYEGYVVPGLSTRNAATVVELGDGQSFAIAGLLQENIREEASKYPFLGEIPILGALFRSSSFQKDETELVIVVTPRLVKPMDLAGATLPTDYYREPTDMEFYFNFNQPEPRAAMSHKETVNATLDGDFGHSFSDTN